jgi:hypothetical protein
MNIADFQLPISNWRLGNLNQQIGNRKLAIEND